MGRAAGAYAWILALALLAVALAVIPSRPAESQAAGQPGEWWMVGRNPERTGAVDPAEMGAAMNLNNLAEAWGWSGSYAMHTSPLIVDVDGDGSPEVVAAESSGRIRVFDGATGTLEATWDAGVSPFSGLAAADVDNDGAYELFYGTLDGHLVRRDGAAETWRYRIGHRADSSPLLADVDGDGALELVYAARLRLLCLDAATGALEWSAPGGAAAVGVNWPAYDPSGGRIVAVDFWGRLRVYEASTGRLLGSLDLTGGSEFALGGPVLGDPDGDGRVEAAVVTGRELYSYAAGSTSWAGRTGTLWVVDVASLAVEASAQVGGPAYFSFQPLALGDVDGDGRGEIVVGSGDGSLYVFRHTGASLVQVYSRVLDSYWSASAGMPSLAVALGDLDGDGVLEVAALSTAGSADTLYYDVHVVDVASNAAYSLRLTYSSRYSASGLSLGDVDGDGQLEIAVSYAARVRVVE